ncbi:excinuclease ABC subunit UvrA [Phaeacidiphilus oryzae]|uniref:excinuclease ABC subunit UvrA n=1 Tax=Phaeacidiphilus oryzae TaxID=348818 RepID=UPI000567F3A5|nr:excinuclease ABC subunit UvrA [Phaeacidiphilus oryzae]
MVRVHGAREHNLRGVDLAVPRDRIAVFTGVSGSGKSSLAFGTIYAEAQRRYLESVSPYARRLIDQVGAPRVGEITGLPPAVALRQPRGGGSARSSVGTVSGLSNVLRMLFSRAGTYPPGAEQLDSDAFSPNTPAGACPACHGLGRVHDVDAEAMVPDPSLSIREGAVAAWPGAWQGKNYRDILGELGVDLDAPWSELPAERRDWILLTEEQPVVTVHPVREAGRIQRPYEGTYSSPRRWVLHTYATTKSRTLRAKAARFLLSRPCPACGGRRLRPEPLAVRFGGRDITAYARLPLAELAEALAQAAAPGALAAGGVDGARAEAAAALVENLRGRIGALVELGLGYLGADRSTDTLSSGELQRLRLGTQLRAGLFGVLYVLDEPSAGLHPADTDALLTALRRLRVAGNSLFVVEHDLDVIRAADWIVDVGPGAGERGGEVLYSGAVPQLADVEESVTRRYLFGARAAGAGGRPGARRVPSGWLELSGVERHNLHGLEVAFPLGAFTAVTGVSGSGKSTLVGQVLPAVVARDASAEAGPAEEEPDGEPEAPSEDDPAAGVVVRGGEAVRRLVRVDQKPIGRSPRSNLATYTGLFDTVRKLFAATREARERGWGAGRFSFNVAGGRCENCQGEGEIRIEMLFLPGATAPCPVCGGRRYNEETLEVRLRGRSVAEVLDLTVEQAREFFAEDPAAARPLAVLEEVGLGYLRLGQPATTLSGGEAQRVKLAAELQRGRRGHTLYVLDEPSTGLHPADVDLLNAQLHGLVDAGHTVVVVEHDMSVAAGADWVIDLGPGGGEAGGRVVAAGEPPDVARATEGATAPHLRRALAAE